MGALHSFLSTFTRIRVHFIASYLPPLILRVYFTLYLTLHCTVPQYIPELGVHCILYSRHFYLPYREYGCTSHCTFSSIYTIEIGHTSRCTFSSVNASYCTFSSIYKGVGVLYRANSPFYTGKKICIFIVLYSTVTSSACTKARGMGWMQLILIRELFVTTSLFCPLFLQKDLCS
jgi:hypothetical protein